MSLIPKLRRRRRDPEGAMTLVEHLEELRRRLVWSFVAIAVGAAVGWFLYNPVIHLLQNPFCETIHRLPPASRPPTGCQFVFNGAVDPVFVKIKVVVFLGPTLVPLLTASSFLSFVVLVALAFGISFEFPIVLIFLSIVGVLSSRKLRDWRRYAIFGISVFAAVITPSADPYSMLAMMIPMVVFYEAAIIVTRLL